MYSIVICSYNRFSYLVETIDALIRILKSRKDYELIIIDNNSSDETCSIKGIYSHVPEVRYFLETNQGLSHARNRGLQESQNEILVYLDDDIDIVDDYFDLCDRIFADKSVNICGGKVLPYKVNIPDWLPEQYFYLVSVFDIGEKERTVNYIMGGNFAIRRDVALKIGTYNVELGRSGTNLMSGEENEYQDRAKRLGYLIEYKPGLTIFHKIEAKLNKEYVLKYAYLNGKSSAILFSSNKIKHYLKKIKSVYRIISYFLFGIIYDVVSNSLLFKIRYEYSKGYLFQK